MFFTVILATASLVFEGAVSQRGIEPQECLKFEVLCNATDYQVRRYNELVWIGTRLTENQLGNFNWRSGVKRLFQYIKGANAAGVMFRSTAQFLTSNTEDRMVNVYLLLPSEYQANPPTPNDKEVFTTRFARMDVYVRSFAGNPRKCRKESKALSVSLTRDNVIYNDSIHYVAFCKRNAYLGAEVGNRVRRSTSKESSQSKDDSDEGTGGDPFAANVPNIMSQRSDNIRERGKKRWWTIEDELGQTRDDIFGAPVDETDDDPFSGDIPKIMGNGWLGAEVGNRVRRSTSKESSQSKDDSDAGTDGDPFAANVPKIVSQQSENIRERGKKRAEIWFIATGSPNCPIS